MNLRSVVLDSFDGLDTLESTSSTFNSKGVHDALKQLINLIIEAAMKFSDAYSGSPRAYTVP
jgi:hypothetical protein